MIPKLAVHILVIASLVLPAFAQDTPPPPVRIRAVLHDPMKPHAELFYHNQAGEPAPLEFRPRDLTETLLMRPEQGTLLLRDSATIDPENPMAGVAATLRLPPALRRGILVVMPAPPNSKLPYRMILIDDSEANFPKGESRVLSLIAVKTAVGAGEHKIALEPGKISRIPTVRRVNEFNMAQTNFYYQHGESWIPFTERQLQYIDACRRVFIVHATPGALQPTVTTIVDTVTGGAP